MTTLFNYISYTKCAIESYLGLVKLGSVWSHKLNDNINRIYFLPKERHWGLVQFESVSSHSLNESILTVILLRGATVFVKVTYARKMIYCLLLLFAAKNKIVNRMFVHFSTLKKVKFFLFLFLKFACQNYPIFFWILNMAFFDGFNSLSQYFFPFFEMLLLDQFRSSSKYFMQWNETKFYQMKAFLVEHHNTTQLLQYRKFEFQ